MYITEKIVPNYVFLYFFGVQYYVFFNSVKKRRRQTVL